MTLTHRLTFARDGPKVMTVTDTQKLPYTFEVGMRVLADGREGMFARIDGDGEVEMLAPNGNRTWHSPADTIAVIDHPGTRGLLLAQYREASGNAYACVSYYYDVDEDDPEYGPAPDWFEGPWGVEVNDGGPRRVVGEGKSEGAAILDALTRLAASKAAAVEPVVDGDCHRRVDALAGRINVLDAKLARMDATLANIADRMANLDGMVAP